MATAKPKSLVDRLFDQAFDPSKHRDPRSSAYKAGVRAVLDFRANGIKIVSPYKIGTAEVDAFFSGTDEGHRVWREHLDLQNNKSEGAA